MSKWLCVFCNLEKFLKMYLSGRCTYSGGNSNIDEIIIIFQIHCNVFMCFSQHRLGAPRSSAAGSVSCWPRRAPRPTPSPCTTTTWTWKPSATSATPCAIPSCELEHLVRKPKTKAADLASSCCFHFPFSFPSDLRWATSSGNTSADPRTYDEVSNEDTQVRGSEADRRFKFGNEKLRFTLM